ncbi:hypothetical protein OAU13_00140 [bacterium]|nr:hypothetical protein [bacterium]
MKTFVIAQHHGVFLTLESLIDCGVNDIVVIIPGSQVNKYNKMYNENSNNPEYAAFRNYDKAISNYVKSKQTDDINIEAYVLDDFEIRDTVCSTLKAALMTGTNEIVTCILSGIVVIKNYTDTIKHELGVKEFGACFSRVYYNDPRLSMYHMLGLPRDDRSLDVGFFVADLSKIKESQLTNDSAFLNDTTKRKQVSIISRDYNGRDDVLIGNAISARQTLIHHNRILKGYVVNVWNKAIKSTDSLKSEEIFGYPLDKYGKYADIVGNYLPISTKNRILANAKETARWTEGLYDCAEVIDLDFVDG